ncbi:MAG TPA: NAD(P)/FAD-dependent oxidoreductase [Steroidobacteraceae bacterium]|jgi:monoamine oxidase|nr:NAD(P)/FAD-dependent oxidoreductase [Steroidobacteraceae bacterium]
MTDPAADVLIIGAGAAGLAAAAELANSGRRMLLLEARDRMGGRIWTRPMPDLAVPIEYGAEFIHGRAATTMAILRSGGKTAIESTDTHFRLHEGELAARNDYFYEVQRAMRASTALKMNDATFDSFLEQSQDLSPEARRYARMMAEGFDAADTRRASARAIAAEWTANMLDDDASRSRPQGGYDALLATLANSLQRAGVRLQLQTIVRRVRWSEGSVEIEGTCIGAPLRASAPRAIITLPLGVLQQPADTPGAVLFSPALDDKRAALQGLASGAVIKLMLRFNSAFWEEFNGGRYRNATFFHAPDAQFPTFWTQLPVRAPLLVAWAGGPKAARLSAAGSPREIVALALAAVQSMFGRDCLASATLEGSYFHDWQQDPFARGAYSYVTVGGQAARARLAAPLANALFFAGEATDTQGETATVTGALQSGQRAAREVLASF